MSENREKTTTPARWTCPACGRENGPEMVCPGCGFDESINCLAYPTLMSLPQRAADPRRARLEAEVKRLQAEKQWRAEEQAWLDTEIKRLQEEKQRHAEAQTRLDAEQKKLEAELLRLQTGTQRREAAAVQPVEPETVSIKEQTRTAEEQVREALDDEAFQRQKQEREEQQRRAEAERQKREQSQRLAAELTRQVEAEKRAKRRNRLLAVAGAAVVVILLFVVIGNSAPTENSGGILGSVGTIGTTSLDGVTAKVDITEIYFLDTLADAPENAADLSEAGNRSVLCWTEDTVQYIAGKGGVVGGSDCSYLFYGYETVTAIHFDGNFDTSNVTYMYRMFCRCSALTALDLSGWDTSNVTNMTLMFCRCSALTALDLSGWDTSNVTYMSYMFYNCSALTSFDPAWLDTSNANTTNMYSGTSWE